MRAAILHIAKLGYQNCGKPSKSQVSDLKRKEFLLQIFAANYIYHLHRYSSHIELYDRSHRSTATKRIYRWNGPPDVFSSWLHRYLAPIAIMNGDFNDLDQRNDIYNLSTSPDHPPVSLNPLDTGGQLHLQQFFPYSQPWQPQVPPPFAVPSNHGHGHVGNALALGHELPLPHAAWSRNSLESMNCRRDSIAYEECFEADWKCDTRFQSGTNSKDMSPQRSTRDSPAIHARPHAAVEQKYRRTLNSKLQQLNASIPATGKFTAAAERDDPGMENDKSESAAKPAVLDKAIQYVTHLVETYHKYEDDIEALREQVREWLGDDDFLRDHDLEDRRESLDHS